MGFFDKNITLKHIIEKRSEGNEDSERILFDNHEHIHQDEIIKTKTSRT